ncbi:MAG: OmpH family outer membrane protein [Desulfovibrionaceae bacterium]
MRKILLFLAVMTLLLPSLASAVEVKIGLVNMQKVMAESEPGQQARNELQKKLENIKNSLDVEKAAIAKMQEDMQKQAMVLSQEAKTDKEIEFKRRVRDYQDAAQNYQRKLQVEESKLTKPLAELIMKAVNDYAVANNFSMILDSASSGLVWAHKETDLTRLLIVEVNRAWRATKQ